MTTALPPALRRAAELLADPPTNPEISKGYLDLLGPLTADAPPRNTGVIQAAWASGLGSMLYDNAQAIGRRLLSIWQLPTGWLNIPPGGVALDVGSGPGNVTASLARRSPDGLALDDISEPMLARAVSAQAPQVGFIRPRRTGCAIGPSTPRPRGCIYPRSFYAGEMARVLRPGGRIIVMVPIGTRGRCSACPRW